MSLSEKEQIQNLHANPGVNLLGTIENFNRQFQVGEKEREAVEWGWNQEPGNTMFHMVCIPERPSSRDYQRKRVIGFRRLVEWCWGW
jgi:hypothetical protein